MSTVTWRRALAAIAATVLGLVALVVVFRSDGLPAVDAASSRATRWFVHQPTGRVVLADGYGGRALASLDVGTGGEQMSVAEGSTGAYVLNESTAEVRAIDSAELRLGPPQGITTLGTGQAVAGVGPTGLVVVDPVQGEGTLLPVGADSVAFEVDAGPSPVIAPDGSVWSIVGDDLVRTTSASSIASALGASGVELSLVGNRPLVVDRTNRRARLGDGGWHALPTEVDPSEIVAQRPGPPGDCGWVGANDDLWCVGRDGIERAAAVPGLDIDGSDFLAIAGDAAALVRRGPTSIVRFDWRTGEILGDQVATVSSDAALDVVATVDLIWVDDSIGNFVWAVHPWGIEAIAKNDVRTLVLGDEGEVVDAGSSDGAVAGAVDDGLGVGVVEREPDDNGVDDPPVAVDDPVTARSGSSVTVPVTANDYDPDGEAIAVVAVGAAGHGSVEIGTATTVVYNPDPGYVGTDEFEYTIADGDGTEASATVVVELLSSDGANQPPIGAADVAQTGPTVPVVVEVLLNDVDPERDALRIGSFTPPAGEATIGTVTETVGPAGLPALRFEPVDGFEGIALFSYRPVDSFEALGDPVDVRVEVARADDDNRPPLARPDAVRLRREVETTLPVLVNDVDPDGDLLTLSVVEPLPDGLDVEVRGEQLAITARAGSADLVPFEYEIDDGRDHVVRGAVLVDVIDDVEPNRPPVVTADSDTAVVGKSVVLDVTANDVDPDGDPLVVVAVTQPADGRGEAIVVGRDRVQFTPAPLADDDDEANARFTYTVSDGNGHEVRGDVTVTVLPEALPEPPYAQDDSTFTFVDQPVTVDVLRNDGDPSGERPTLVGTPGCAGGGRAIVTANSQVRYDPPAGQSGAFRCSYEVTNSQGLRASASIIISVREPEIVNAAPIALLDSLTVEIEETASIDVTANDSDPDGDDAGLEVVSSTAPTLGRATRNGNTITFSAGSTTGVATINYQVADAEGAVSLGRLSVRITEKANVAPRAQPAALTIFGPGVPTTFDVLSSAFDPDETPGGLRLVSAALVSGDASVSSSGTIVTISPDPEFVGDVRVSYTVADAEGLEAQSQLTLTILEPLNRPPVANDDLNTVANGGAVSTAVLFNDTDPDGDPLTISLVSSAAPSLGTTSLNSDRTIGFAATPGASGTAVIVYEISDGEFADRATLTITVRPCSESAPVANDGFLETGYRQPIAVNLNNFASNGTVTDVVVPPGFANGVYTPPSGENGNVQITYAVVNGCRQRATGTVTIDVNQDPVPQPQTITMGRTEVREIPVTTLAGDDEALVIVSSQGAPEWVTSEPGRLVLDPTLGTASGDHSWTSVVRDPGGLTASVPITVTIVNQAPTAVADSVDVSGGKDKFEITDNDLDPDGDPDDLRIQSVPATITFTNGMTGTVSITGNGREVEIDPGAGLGSSSFEYTVVDPSGAVSAPAVVSVTAAPIPTTTTTTTTTTTVPPTTTTGPATTTTTPTTQPPTSPPPTTTTTTAPPPPPSTPPPTTTTTTAPPPPPTSAP